MGLGLAVMQRTAAKPHTETSRRFGRVHVKWPVQRSSQGPSSIAAHCEDDLKQNWQAEPLGSHS